jgi:NadR type nicotinamide-nucleotide adenylyltransferase
MSGLGVVIGKFLPPHRGHSHLIETACGGADHVLVIVAGRPDDLIPAHRRADMLRELHPTTTVVVTPDDIPDRTDDGGEATSRAWADRTRVLAAQACGRVPAVVFTSEEYGPRYARWLGARHVSVDPGRVRYPISGTAVRADPWGHAGFLAPVVRAWFVQRISVVGAESTGTTTLSRALAEHYGAACVPEYGREFCTRHDGRWRSADFEHIAERQLSMEDSAAGTSGRLLVCDTDALATSIWHERYLGHRSAVVDRLAASRSYTTYLLTSDDIPFVQDGTRDGEHIRGWMTQRFRAALAARPEPWLELRGDRATRLATAIAHVDALLTPPPFRKVPFLTFSA